MNMETRGEKRVCHAEDPLWRGRRAEAKTRPCSSLLQIWYLHGIWTYEVLSVARLSSLGCPDLVWFLIIVPSFSVNACKLSANTSTSCS
jgi:hypothetical protein